MDQSKTNGRGRLLYLVSGIVIGSLVTSYLASLAVERRDAVVVSTYHGLEGARSLQAARAGQPLDAYAHQANMVAVMEHKNGALGLDLVPWSLWTPFSSIAQALIVPTPKNSWSDGALQAQKNRWTQLSK